MPETLLAYLPFAAGLAATGAITGVMAGLLGIGGGIVMVPAMVLAYGIMGFDPAVTMHVALATSLAVIIPTGARSAMAHDSRGAVDRDILRRWALWIVIFALVGGLTARLYPAEVLKAIFGVAVLFIALNLALPIQRMLMEKVAGVPMVNRISASIIGYISALMGVGGGAFSVPTLVAFGLPMHTAVGTGSALGVLLAIPAALGYAISGWGVAGVPPLSVGYVNLPSLVVLGAVSVLTAPIGVAIAHRLDGRVLRLGFAAFQVVVGLRMLSEAVFG
ncbi:sulfite exporter TauE/SafE family protein [Pelagibacterium montanilacus]|uniref:sulfite exporter TauE/SafE family protein n=1 Tax=Pelagibacterium montanilacus TaxID=2185280 RepID=UPI001FE443EE|nr:sulfite exporter TauE/SafE family protein [Pelagibacterium montanilacus]